MKRIDKALTATLALMLACSLAACGMFGASADNSAAERSSFVAIEEPAAPEPEGSYAIDDYEFAEEAEISSNEAKGVSGTDFTTVANTPSALEDQKLIYTADVSIDTTDFQKSIDALRKLMADCDAFAEYEDQWSYGSQDLHVLNVTLRVPAEKYDELMAGMDGIEGTVTNRSSQVINITREYADNEAVIEGLEIQEERLLDMMEKAETIEEMILVEERLSEVQIELNRTRTSRENMDSEVSLSTVCVTINEVRYSTTTTETGYLERVGNAFADMWDSLVEGVGDFGIALIYAIPAIVVLVVIILLVRRAIRNYNKKKGPELAAARAQVNAPAEPEADK